MTAHSLEERDRPKQNSSHTKSGLYANSETCETG